MPVPSRSAESSVRDSDSDPRPGAGAGGEANGPRSRRLDQTKYPPCPEPRTFTIVRRRLTKTYQRPPAGFSPGWVATSAHSPSRPHAHVRRLHRQPDAARRPAAQHQGRLRRSVTPSPSDSPASRPGPAPAAIPAKPPGPPAVAAAAGPYL